MTRLYLSSDTPLWIGDGHSPRVDTALYKGQCFRLLQVDTYSVCLEFPPADRLCPHCEGTGLRQKSEVRSQKSANTDF